MATGDVFFESDGKSVDVTLTATVVKSQIAVVDGWVGITGGAGESGDDIALLVGNREWQIEVPTALAVDKGDIIYIDPADITGHTPDASAYSKAAGAGLIAFAKATADQDANDVVTATMLAHAALAS